MHDIQKLGVQYKNYYSLAHDFMSSSRHEFGLMCSCIITFAGIFTTTDLSNMMEESVKMSKFNHPNVMKLIGVCIDKGASPYIVMPYMVYGSLLSYLKKQRAELTLANEDDQELVRA